MEYRPAGFDVNEDAQGENCITKTVAQNAGTRRSGAGTRRGGESQ